MTPAGNPRRAPPKVLMDQTDFSVAAVDRLEEVTVTARDSRDQSIRSRSRAGRLKPISGTVTVSFGPSKTASSYLPVTADGLSRSKLAYVYYFTVLAAYITRYALLVIGLHVYRCGFILIKFI